MPNWFAPAELALGETSIGTWMGRLVRSLYGSEDRACVTHAQPIIPSSRSIVPLNFFRSDVVTPDVSTEMGVGWNEAWELSIHFGGTRLAYGGIESVVATAIAID